jgi:antitoxin ParD1/3/4
MNTIDINLPDPLKAFVEEQVARRGYRDASEFVQLLLEAERQRQVGREVEQLLLDALDDDDEPLTEWTDQDLDDIRRAGRRLIEKRRRP